MAWVSFFKRHILHYFIGIVIVCFFMTGAKVHIRDTNTWTDPRGLSLNWTILKLRKMSDVIMFKIDEKRLLKYIRIVYIISISCQYFPVLCNYFWSTNFYCVCFIETYQFYSLFLVSLPHKLLFIYLPLIESLSYPP